jgi:hypothetical protein
MAPPSTTSRDELATKSFLGPLDLGYPRCVRTNLRGTIAAVTLAAIAGIVGGCSSSTATPTPNGGSSTTSANAGSSSTAQSPAAEYLILVQPVDTTRAAFKASRTSAELKSTAGPFAAALQKWQGELSAVSWPTAAQPAIRTIVTDVPLFLPGLDEFASGNIDYAQFVARDGRLATALDIAASAARQDLGLPAL